MSVPTSDLTILLPLKGRHLHTLRFLWDANRRKLPYKFLIADGEVHPTIAGMLEGPSKAFPHLDIEYIRYPDDASFSDFYRKMADAAGRVRTKYVMQADNDDFLIASGIDRCLSFLDANPDYQSFGGGVGAFALAPTGSQFDLVTGPLDKLAFRYGPGYWPKDLFSPEALARCTSGFKSVIYYNVYRAPALAIILRELAAIDFTDLELHESFFTLHALTLGKSGQDARVISYLRQMGTSSASAWNGDDWVGYLLKSRFTDDFKTYLSRISTMIAAADGIDAGTAATRIRDLYAAKLRGDLAARYPTLSERPRYHPIRIIKATLAAFGLNGLLEIYRKEVARRAVDPQRRAVRVESERQSIVSNLKAMNASTGEIETILAEFAVIESGMKGDAFEKFAADATPDLLPRSRPST
ncbi:TIGR00180 family glycosyltransferase [Afipia sp. TerB]